MTVSTMFHEAVIGRITFQAFLTNDGPSLVAVVGPNHVLGAPLGDSAEIVRFGAESIHPNDPGGKPGFYIAKYGVSRDIPLEGFGQKEFAQLRSEFGILRARGDRDVNAYDAFWESEAAKGLVAFVKEHPIVASRYADETHRLGDWHAHAVELAATAVHAPAPGM